MRSTSRYKLFVVLLSALLWLVSCQTTKPAPQASPTSPVVKPNPFTIDPETSIDVQALDEVVILFDDPTPTAAALQAQAQRVPQQFLQPTGFKTQTLSTQAFADDAAKAYAQMVMNLVGGVRDVTAVMKPVSQYQAGDANNVKHTFYIGSFFDNNIPAALIQDIATGSKVTWINYNIWKLDQALNSLGLTYTGIEAASAADAPNSFNTIDYKGYSFKKDLVAMEMVQVQTSGAAEVIAYAKKPTGEQTPYVVKSGNFWYVADLPLAFATETDRYLVFADLIPEMIGVATECTPKAVIRIEDVSAFTNSAELERLTTAFNEMNIPHGIATFPFFRDENAGTSLDLSNNQATYDLLTAAEAGIGEILQHGTYHMTPGYANPSSISGLDWEFWDINTNTPLANFSTAQAVERVQLGKTELEAKGLSPIGWVTPHYAANVDFLPAFKDIYFRQFERRFISSGEILTGQFFPYPVRDIYNRTLLIPENTNFVGANNRLPDILEKARANSVLSCPWVGMFVHPYVFDPAYTGAEATSIEDYKAFLTEIKNLGYEFVRPSTVDLNPVSTTPPPPPPAFDGTVTSLNIVDLETNQSVASLQNGDSLELETLPANAAIMAVTTGAVESVSFELNTVVANVDSEPYALAFGVTEGSYSLNASPYSQDAAQGDKGAGLSLNFEIIKEATPPPPPPTDDNLLTNPGFESDLANWLDCGSAQALSSDAYEGQKAGGLGQAGCFYQDLRNLSAGSNLTFSCFVKETGEGWTGLGIDAYDVTGKKLAGSDTEANSGVYSSFSTSLRLPVNTAFVTPWVYSVGGAVFDSCVVASDDTPPPPPSYDGEVTSFSLVNATTNRIVGSLNNGDTIDLSKLGTNSISIIAKTAGTVESVKFVVNGQNVKVENIVPYALLGDDNGNYAGWRPARGSYSLTATPYQKDNTQGEVGKALTINFTVGTSPVAASFESDLEVQHSKLCLDAFSANLFQWTCSDYDNQKFEFKPVTGKLNTYNIRSKSTGQCLDVFEARTTDNTNLIRYACGTQTNQQFSLVSIGANYQLRAIHSNKCIALKDAATYGGANFVQLSCDSTDSSQLFAINK